MAKKVELGYVEESDASVLKSPFFPSKVGGKPAWLSYSRLPSCSDTLKCSSCGSPLAFLLQVYAPIPDQSDCFHRTVFVFVCRNPDCSKTNSADNFVVLRSQLPRDNEFYLSRPIADSTGSEAIETLAKLQGLASLCVVCGCASFVPCSECSGIYCCSEQHRALHANATHKQKKNNDRARGLKLLQKFLFPEFELVTEAEEYHDEKAPERPKEERMKAYQEFVRSQLDGMSLIKEPVVDDLSCFENVQDKCFKAFKSRVSQNPEQVIRYQLNGDPLWAGTAIPTAIVPCEYCNGARRFEFQIMPHLLSYLDVDSLDRSIDWATVAVYTCSRNCPPPDGGYAKEFVWKQDYNS